eukprot:COSAG01_NODE_802_length_13465_cov_24.092242_8_plen_475_part_00
MAAGVGRWRAEPRPRGGEAARQRRQQPARGRGTALADAISGLMQPSLAASGTDLLEGNSGGGGGGGGGSGADDDINDDDDAVAYGEAVQLLGTAASGSFGDSGARSGSNTAAAGPAPRRRGRAAHRQQQLRRELGTWDGVAIVVGVIVGSGIFASPGVVLSDCGSVGLGLLAWLIAGVLAAASALVYCELGAMMPSAGGDFEYLTRAWGGDVAFAWALAQFTVQKPCSLAIVSLVVGRYVTAALGGELAHNSGGESPTTVLVFAVCYVLVITAVNVLPVGAVAKLQDAMTLTKPVLVGGLVFCAVVHAAAAPTTLARNFENVWAGSSVEGLGPGVFAALWAFNGWTNVVHMAEEMEDPQRQLPRAIILGMLTVVLIYVACNLSYLAVLPAFGLPPAVSLASTSVAASATVKVAAATMLPKQLAAIGPAVTSLLIFISGVGTSNVTVMTGGRCTCVVCPTTRCDRGRYRGVRLPR